MYSRTNAILRNLLSGKDYMNLSLSIKEMGACALAPVKKHGPCAIKAGFSGNPGNHGQA